MSEKHHLEYIAKLEARLQQTEAQLRQEREAHQQTRDGRMKVFLEDAAEIKGLQAQVARLQATIEQLKKNSRLTPGAEEKNFAPE